MDLKNEHTHPQVFLHKNGNVTEYWVPKFLTTYKISGLPSKVLVNAILLCQYRYILCIGASSCKTCQSCTSYVCVCVYFVVFRINPISIGIFTMLSVQFLDLSAKLTFIRSHIAITRPRLGEKKKVKVQASSIGAGLDEWRYKCLS